MDSIVTQTAIEDIAAALVAARRSGTAADESPWSATVLSQADIYRVQDRVSQTLGWDAAAADRPGHWKGGGAGPGSVAAFAQVPAPWTAASPATLNTADFDRLGIEIEVAFRLARDVRAEDLASRTTQDPAGFLDAMAVSIELVDFRWRGQQDTRAELRACDLQSNAALVVGEWTPFRPVDWAAQVATLEVDGRPVGRYQGAHAAGDPLWFARQWLEHAVARHGRLLEGSVLTTGSWCGMVWLDGPAQVTAAFDGIGEARLTLA
ncbi:2-keto-4-pentenoate hydratase [Xylophilus sp. Kf1]|nr:2-keto-4-pentenoate hydratase [Xylophilus sp. Kf1]